VVFLLPAVEDFRLLVFVKSVRDTLVARWDAHL
jgi:hypothetical protein